MTMTVPTTRATRTRTVRAGAAVLVLTLLSGLLGLGMVGASSPASAQRWGKTNHWPCDKYNSACIRSAHLGFGKRTVHFSATYRWLDSVNVVVIDVQPPKVNPGPEYVIRYANGGLHHGHASLARLKRIDSWTGAIAGHPTAGHCARRRCGLRITARRPRSPSPSRDVASASLRADGSRTACASDSGAARDRVVTTTSPTRSRATPTP